MEKISETEFARRVNGAGGRAFIVGGWVRDKLRGVSAHDKDYVVAGLTAKQVETLFPAARLMGKSFPVYRLNIDGAAAELALARTERKSGPGYRGFAVAADPRVTIEQDLLRRDTTMNSMALELPDGGLIDPFGGAADIAAKIIRTTGPHFGEDPVRALRAARQAAAFGFDVEQSTVAAMRDCGAELAREPVERLMGELARALATDRPSVFFRVLQSADLLRLTFPEIYRLIGQTQPTDFHPEGDAYEHSLLTLDQVAAATDDVITRFAALVHDIGKGMTPPEQLPHHYDHPQTGLIALDEMDRRLHLPRKWYDAAAAVIGEHMRAARLTHPGKILDLLLAIDRLPISCQNFNIILVADGATLPDYLADAERFLTAIREVSGHDAPVGLDGPAVGTWLREARLRILQRELAGGR